MKINGIQGNGFEDYKDVKPHGSSVTQDAPEKPDGTPKAGKENETPAAKKENDLPAAEKTTVNTDKVDREIKQLKEKKHQLEQQIKAEQDKARRADLERQLHMVESALSFKDNDTYRRQNAVVV